MFPSSESVGADAQEGRSRPGARPPVVAGLLVVLAAMVLWLPSSAAAAPHPEPRDASGELALALASSDPAWSHTRSDTRVVCLPDEQGDARVEFLFVTEETSAALPVGDMRRAAAWVDRVFADSASVHDSGSFRAVRWVQTTESPGICQVDPRRVVVPAGTFEAWADRTDGLGWQEFTDSVLNAAGSGELGESPRRYLVWADMSHSHGYCGHADTPKDPEPDPELNAANGSMPRVAVVYAGCRGRWLSTEAHELVHTFGAILDIAPHYDPDTHCTDFFDRMCRRGQGTDDATCTDTEWNRLLDCGGDDYFNPGAPLYTAAGQEFWNTADSVFLTSQRPSWWVEFAESQPRSVQPKSSGDGVGSAVNFADAPGHVFQSEMVALAASGITRGCNPPANTFFCPDETVTRGEMAAFLSRALELDGGGQRFADTGGHLFESESTALAAAGIAKGCNPPANSLFCPDSPVTRGQMAAFLSRAVVIAGEAGAFSDTTGHVFETEIAGLAAAGVTRGCNPPTNDRFCPDQPVTRGEMAAFLVRAGLTG